MRNNKLKAKVGMLDTANSTMLSTSLSQDYGYHEPMMTKGLDAQQPASKPTHWPESDSLDSLKKASYGKQLQEQIAQRQQKKYEDLLTDRQNDLRLLRERKELDPFGKQGSGAPLRDGNGNIITLKNKALFNMHEQIQKPSLFAGAQPAFSLKARLARENLLSRSTANLSIHQSAPPTQRSLKPDILMETPFQPEETSHNNHNLSAPSEIRIPPKTPMLHSSLQLSSLAPASSSLLSPFAQPPQFYPIYMFPPPNSYSGFSQGSPILVNGIQREDHYSRTNEDLSHYETSGRLMGRNTDREVPKSMFWEDRANEGEQKSKRMLKYQEYQNDLLKQMEEKKKIRDSEEMKKKFDDILEEARIKNHNEELRYRDKQELEKKKLAFEKTQADNQRIAANTLDFVVSVKKGKPKRPRTPIEEVEERIRLEKLEQERNRLGTLVDEKGNKIQVEINIDKKDGKTAETDSEQVADLKNKLGQKQDLMQGQLTEVKQRLMEINRERILNGYEIEDLKQKLKQQQVMEEVRRAELYHTLLESHRQPTILPTITYLKLDKEEEFTPFSFPLTISDIHKRSRSLNHNDGGDSLDAMIACQTHNLPLDYKFVPTNMKAAERIELRPGSSESPDDDKQSGLRYLNYFNPTEHNTGIKIENSVDRFDLLKGHEKGKKPEDHIMSQVQENVNQILKKNKDRLRVLEDLETKEHIEYGKGPNSMEQVNSLKGAFENDFSFYRPAEALIQKMNNSRKYQDDY